MKVLLICNNAYNPGNGLSVAVLTNLRRLKERGVDARLMAVRNPDPDGPQPDFPLDHFIFPIFEPIIAANGFCYAKINRKKISEAIDWADVVHFEEAMPLEDVAIQIAKKKGKACVATFHLFPHNITANLGFPKKNFLNPLLMKYWNARVFNKCSDIHCPTIVCKQYLMAKRTQSRFHVISNGIEVPAEPVRILPYGDMSEIRLLCVGRFASEKSQNTLIEAVRYSKYASRIRLCFAGTGPREKQYRKQANELYRNGVLKFEPEFGFYTHEELHELASKCYLYVHCAWVEVEGLSCLEATLAGAVPVIGEGRHIGTTKFALCPESVYPAGDSRALAGRIDWWIEHPEERDRYSQAYADAARRFSVDDSMNGMLEMYRQALSK